MAARRAALAALLVLAVPSPAHADEADAVERDATALAARAGGGASDLAFADWKRRLDEAATLVLLDQYDEAAFRYYVLVNDPAGQGHPELREAIWWLAESLYLSKDAPAAKPYYETLAADGLEASYARDAAVRLIEIASDAGDDAAVDDAWTRYVASSTAPVPPEVAYALAKSYWRRGDLDRADALFAKLPLDGVRGRQSAYFRAVIDMKRGHDDAAEKAFAAIVQLPVKNDEQQAIADESVLAVGRLLYARGAYREASDALPKVSDRSPEKGEALYEEAWAEVKAGRPRDAADTLDLFLVTFPDDPLTPKVTLLRARALLSLKDEDGAQDVYRAFQDDYAAVPARLKALLAHAHSDPQAFLAEVGATGGTAAVARGLPKPIVDAALARPDVKRAVGMATSLDSQRKATEDARTLVEQIADGLQAAVIAGLPADNEMRRNAADLDLRAQRARLALLPKSPEVAAASKALDAAVAAHAAAEKAQKAELGEIFDLRAQLQKSLSDIQTQRSQLVALAKYGRDSADQAAPDPKLIEAGEEANRELADLDEQQARIAPLLRRLKSREATTLAAALGPDEIAARAALDVALSRAQSAVASRLAPDASAKLDRLAAARAKIAEALVAVDADEKAKLADARRVLDAEGKGLDADDRALAATGAKAEAAAASGVRDGLQQVAGGFDDLLLRADLGGLDVAWLRKDRETARIDALVSQRKEALDELARRFAPLFEEAP